jgi:hypothetical protein
LSRAGSSCFKSCFAEEDERFTEGVGAEEEEVPELPDDGGVEDFEGQPLRKRKVANNIHFNVRRVTIDQLVCPSKKNHCHPVRTVRVCLFARS